MRAVVLSRSGGPTHSNCPTFPCRQSAPGSYALGFIQRPSNHINCQIRRGDYADLVPLPAIIGHDVPGVVEEARTDVTGFAADDRPTVHFLSVLDPVPNGTSSTSTLWPASRRTSIMLRRPA
ncbi:alcohol dehydrogenase catalytic domain-containing protein [Sphingomonas zeicaulis]|uniref:alcohol dehydrogenase catalytic domain-containing protein n=1 Tax=Sphingomonas zeicaulis TaxID=1632740 RepID=UPI003D19AC05